MGLFLLSSTCTAVIELPINDEAHHSRTPVLVQPVLLGNVLCGINLWCVRTSRCWRSVEDSRRSVSMGTHTWMRWEVAFCYEATVIAFLSQPALKPPSFPWNLDIAGSVPSQKGSSAPGSLLQCRVCSWLCLQPSVWRWVFPCRWRWGNSPWSSTLGSTGRHLKRVALLASSNATLHLEGHGQAKSFVRTPICLSAASS